MQAIVIVLLAEIGGRLGHGAVLLVYAPVGCLVDWRNPIRDPNELLRFISRQWGRVSYCTALSVASLSRLCFRSSFGEEDEADRGGI